MTTCVCRQFGGAQCPATLFHDTGGCSLKPGRGAHLDTIDLARSQGVWRCGGCAPLGIDLADWRERAGLVARSSAQPSLTAFLFSDPPELDAEGHMWTYWIKRAEAIRRLLARDSSRGGTMPILDTEHHGGDGMRGSIHELISSIRDSHHCR